MFIYSIDFEGHGRCVHACVPAHILRVNKAVLWGFSQRWCRSDGAAFKVGSYAEAAGVLPILFTDAAAIN